MTTDAKALFHGKPAHMDLFSGIGGFSLAAEWAGFKTIAHSEIDPDASLVLKHHWPDTPNLGDIKIYESWKLGTIDLITGGVPCQPASNLGKRRGTNDERWLWPETLGVIGKFRPRFAVFENPPAILTLEGGRAFNGIVSGLVALGYDLWWEVLSAASVGAGHLRERLFIVASQDTLRPRSRGEGGDALYKRWPASQNRREGISKTTGRKNGSAIGNCGATTSHAADTDSQRSQINPLRRGKTKPSSQRILETSPSPNNNKGLQGQSGDGSGTQGWDEPGRSASTPLVFNLDLTDPRWFETQSPVAPLVSGLPPGLVEAACRCVGNSVVPQAAFQILKSLNP